MSVEEAPGYYQLVLNILCDVINYCALGKLRVYDQIVIKNLKMRRNGY